MNSSKDYLVNSVVIIAPAFLKTQCDQIANMMGWGDNSFSIPLTTNGTDVTHYGLRSECDDKFIGWLRGVDLPWTFNPAVLKPILEMIVVDVSPNPDNPEEPALWGSAHFDNVCAKNNVVIFGY